MSGGDLDEFRLVRPLGRGAMGELYVGHDTVLDRAVAIKLIGISDPDRATRERFLTEARAIARLSHPNVVTIFRVGSTPDGRPFLVQELIDGTSLDRAPRPVPAGRLGELALGIARGLEAAHRHGILHRDIKPANVMVDARGVARLLDFGLAKLTSTPAEPRRPRAAIAGDVAETQDVPASPAAAAHDTVSIGLIGTPRYLAPELWRGEPATVRSDLYAFGVMLYELATGAPPYPQTELGELERAVAAGGARAVGELVPALRAALARLITRCLAADPAERPATAGELVAALEAADAPEGNPYRGLRAFGAEHRGAFFGRASDIEAMIERLRGAPLLAIAGDSGIGKSSVCHAGVAAAVTAGALGDRRAWRAVTIVPGRAPWKALSDALGDPVPRPADGEGLLIVVDQLEELITLAEPAQAIRTAALLASIADGVPGIKALLAVRGDFLTRVAALPGLGEPLTRGLQLLRVLSTADLREAVVGPARARGFAFETDAMIDELVAAVAGNPGALPLLQFTLAALWEARDAERRVIPEAALAELGGVDGALARHADAVLLELDAEHRSAARGIVLRLVSAEHTRAVRTRDELVVDHRSAAALEALVRGRLVVARDTIDGAPGYELAHEALIRSWGTLRDWLDDAAGQHAARNRLIASAAAWDRLHRRSDLLWSRRQLDEVHDVGDLPAKERAFLAASRRRLQLQRARRIAMIVGLPLAALAVWAAIRIDAGRRRDRAVDAMVGVATELRVRGDVFAAHAARARTAAFARFDALDLGVAERTWQLAHRFGELARAAYSDAAADLEAAHRIDDEAARAEMAAVLDADARLARDERDGKTVDELVRRLATYDRRASAAWTAPGHLTIELDRAARVALHARRKGSGPTIAGGFEATPLIEGAIDHDLAPGSYLAVITFGDGLVVRDPVRIDPGAHLVRQLHPPAVPAGYAYVAAGRFLFGSERDDSLRRDFQFAVPMHEVATDAFLIGRTEVTFADWLEYLHDLPPAERELRRQHGATVALLGDTTLVLKPTTQTLTSEGELLTYPDRSVRRTVRWRRLPVSGISWQDALAYTAWLDRTGRLPHARPCTCVEWERAARGSDGRSYPHGDTLLPDEANIDATYGSRPLSYGPDEVATHRASDSPYELSDMAGNVWELVSSPTGGPWLKGGAWYASALTASVAGRNFSAPDQLANRVGLRVCASVTGDRRP